MMYTAYTEIKLGMTQIEVVNDFCFDQIDGEYK
jgi:hypothetical protein